MNKGKQGCYQPAISAASSQESSLPSGNARLANHLQLDRDQGRSYKGIPPATTPVGAPLGAINPKPKYSSNDLSQREQPAANTNPDRDQGRSYKGIPPATTPVGAPLGAINHEPK